MAKYALGFPLLCLAVIGLDAPAFAQASLATEVQAINASFVCPEKMASDAMRKHAMDEIGRRLAAHRLSYSQAQKVIQTMYGLHGCGVSSSGAIAVSATTTASGR